MTARIAIIAMLLAALAVGAGIYYTQVYAFYERLEAEQIGPVALLPVEGEVGVPVEVSGIEAIDSPSSPIRFRACMEVADPDALAGAALTAEEAAPLTAPGWFDCYDAEMIGDALEAGQAQAYLWRGNAPYGIDRVLAVFPDGRAYGWTQLNACGRTVFDGDPAPAGCPPPPPEYAG
ncbi:DUF6446 family protein [Pseudoroseicyclus aestuarii]|uniref:Histidine kinase n=1 Tax=Pseudoroseicyclus aestuarii TaxID=1795041 RepID=A0A318T180_9RHOB|nr:DUF6446 family protein [Pseudoroseicyclus aestuarii]PYE85737.1 hypothetical protein DFP88_101409 [Pseudoroseicyclus aestuarii]